MAPSLEIEDTIPLAFNTSDDEWKEITCTIGVDTNNDSLDAMSYVVNDIKLTTSDYDFTIQEDIYNRIIEGDDNMFIKNEVLKLYYNKKREEIIDKYDEKEQEYFTQNEVVKQFNELIEKFENDLDNLYTSVENFDTDYITVRYDENNYKYKVNTDKLSEEFKKVHIKEREKELEDLEDFVKEVEAQLSLSNDLDYQLEVLTRYDIIDKKTKKMVD